MVVRSLNGRTSLKNDIFDIISHYFSCLNYFMEATQTSVAFRTRRAVKKIGIQLPQITKGNLELLSAGKEEELPIII